MTILGFEPKSHLIFLISKPKPEIIRAKKEVVEKKATWAGGKGTSNPLSEVSHTKYEKGEKVIVKQKAVKVTDQLGPPPRLSDLP